MSLSGSEKGFVRDECLIGVGHDFCSVLVEWDAEALVLNELRNTKLPIRYVFHFDQPLFLSCDHDERAVVGQSQIMF